MTKKHLVDKIKRIQQDNPDLDKSSIKSILRGLDDYKNGRVKSLNSARLDDESVKDINFGKKPTLSLVPATAIIHISTAMEDGVKKRSAYNWRENPVSASNLIDKMERHLQLLKDRHDFADDSGLHELAHLLADGCVYLDAMEQGTLVDDRPIAGKANDVMKRFTKE